MNCAIYTRVSTDNQTEKEYNSCEAQEEKIKSYIRSQEDLTLYKVYSDPGFSGASLDRPGLKELLNNVVEGKIDRILTYKIDRLTRTPKDFYTLIELFDKHGVSFISVTENFDATSPSGRLLRNIEIAEPVTQDEPTKMAKFLRDGGQVESEFVERERARRTNEYPLLCV